VVAPNAGAAEHKTTAQKEQKSDMCCNQPPNAGVLAPGVAAAPKPPAPNGEGAAAAPNAGAAEHEKQYSTEQRSDMCCDQPPNAGVLAAGVAAAPNPPAPKGEGATAAPNAGAARHKTSR
jgi:hypothetical protein